MADRLQKQRRIIDLATMEEIDITGKVKEFCELHGLDQGSVYRLNSGILRHIFGRFIDVKSLKDCFELIDIDSGEVYKCITSATIFHRLGFDYNDNEAKYVYELKSGRQYRASICGRVLQLNGSEKRKVKQTKNESATVSEDIKKSKEIKRIKQRAHSRISSVFRAKDVSKNKKAKDLIGCDLDEFVEYIKSKFTPGMTIENYGEWEVDHIIPCKNFDLKKEEDLAAAFNYTNLQPVWATSKIALDKGFDNYIGNRNKNSTNTMEEYYTTYLITKTFPDITIDDARFYSSFLFKNGIRKLLPKYITI